MIVHCHFKNVILGISRRASIRQLCCSSRRPFTMSWMDSWSRPLANSKVPAPYYLANQDTPYCRSCGRVMSEWVATD